MHDDTRGYRQLVICLAKGEDEVGELNEQHEKNKGGGDFLFHMELLGLDAACA